MTSPSLLEKAASNKIIVIVCLLLIGPVGLYLMWKGQHFSNTVRWVITVFIAWWTFNILAGDYSTDLTGGCSATFQQGGCTYYRDDNCQVIGKSC